MDPVAERLPGGSGRTGGEPGRTGARGGLATALPGRGDDEAAEDAATGGDGDDPVPPPARGIAPDRDPAAIAADTAPAPDASAGRTRRRRAPRPKVSARELWRSAFSLRMVGLLVLLLAAAVVCVQLAAWQLDRASLRGAERAIAEHAATLEADPVPLDDALRAQSSFSSDVYATGVSVIGRWEPENQVLVVDRAVEGEPAVLVVTALRLTDGPDAGAMIPVLRGWLPADDVSVTDAGAQPADPAALDVPDGEVTVTGHLSNSEAQRTGDAAPGTALSISTPGLAGEWGGPTFSGYLVQGAHDGEGWVPLHGADDALEQAPDPTIAVETGLNIQNLAYAIEWLVFGGFALWLWWRLVRDDALDRRDEELLDAEPVGPDAEADADARLVSAGDGSVGRATAD
ncbi:SURF1 family protein [Georgenia sp. Z1491]|uniref:SURF1 family protein n=1 Tax=Georgenia sp. Z1491 TaxID=3416707 RepID=UPI003CEEE474